MEEIRKPDREKVIKGLGACYNLDSECEGCPYVGEIFCMQTMLLEAIAALKEQPEIVRCRDCVFGGSRKNDSAGTHWIYCMHHRENRPEEWFCASGSRI